MSCLSKYKKAVNRSLRDLNDTRLYARENFYYSDKIDNIYLSGLQKSGSQWLKALLLDPELNQYYHLAYFWQRRYEYGEFVHRFPRGTLVPGLYISRHMYDEILKPPKYKTLYTLRDPRNIITSLYDSTKYTHAPIGKVLKQRSTLFELNYEDGINYLIDQYDEKLAGLRSWMNIENTEKEKIVRLENINQNYESEAVSLLSWLFERDDYQKLKSIANRYSRENMRVADLKQRSSKSLSNKNPLSHYKSTPSDFKSTWSDKNREYFHSVTGNLLAICGYE